MVTRTSTDVDELDRVSSNSGQEETPANEAEQQKMNNRLGNWSSGYDNTKSPGDTQVHSLDTGVVPDGVTVTVQADPGNAAPVKIGLTASPSVRMKPGQSYECQPTDRSQVQYQLEDSTDTIHISHEDTA